MSVPKIHLLAITARPGSCAQALDAWCRTASERKNIEIHCGVDTIDDKVVLQKALETYNISAKNIYATYPSRRGVTYPLYCVTSILQADDDDIVIVVSDDFFPFRNSISNWDTHVRKLFAEAKENGTHPKGVFIVQDDGYQSKKSDIVCTIPVLNFRCLKTMNRVLYSPSYYHMFSDIELFENARDLGVLMDIREDKRGPSYYRIFQHLHWCTGHRVKDHVDNEVTHGHWTRDEVLYHSRKSLPVENRLQVPYKKRVCFSLWGTPEPNEMYLTGAEKNIEAFALHFPDIICRFYIEDSLSDSVSKRLELSASNLGKQLEIVKVRKTDANAGMFWRFDGALDETTILFLSRDTDSRLIQREVDAIKSWIESDKCFHIMRDHPYHTVPILGGLWGCRFGIFKERSAGNTSLKALIDNYPAKSLKGCDQDFLEKYVFPIVKKDSLIHDEITNLRILASSLPFPTQRVGREYVGGVYELGNTEATYSNLITPVPLQTPAPTIIKTEQSNITQAMSELLKYRKNIHSQNGESGVVNEILKRLSLSDFGDKPRWFVEFGAWDGKHLSNTFHLLNDVRPVEMKIGSSNVKTFQPKWRGVYIEGDRQKFVDLLKTADETVAPGQIVPVCAFVDDKLLSLDSILQNEVPEIPLDYELCSIDIDSTDYQVWRAVEKYRPKIVIIEINSSYPPNIYKFHSDAEPLHINGGTSFTPMVELGKHKGYSLVCHIGNLVFVRDDLVPTLGLNLPSDPNSLYMPNHSYIFN